MFDLINCLELLKFNCKTGFTSRVDILDSSDVAAFKFECVILENAVVILSLSSLSTGLIGISLLLLPSLPRKKSSFLTFSNLEASSWRPFWLALSLVLLTMKLFLGEAVDEDEGCFLFEGETVKDEG